MALTCSARIEVNSLDGCLELLGNRKLFYIEICILDDTFCTDSMFASNFMIFDEVFVFRKEFPKTYSLQDIVNLIKENSARFSLVEITNPGCITKTTSIACGKMPLNSFLFPASNIKKYHTIKLFPHQKFRPVLKFWVEAVIYRAYSGDEPQMGADYLTEIPFFEDDKEEPDIENELLGMGQVGASSSEARCVLCDVFMKHLGKPYCGHQHDCTNICLGAAKKCEVRRKPKCSPKHLAKEKVQFWLNQLHMLSSKPVDEFTNLLRNMYTKEYSKALGRYNRITSKR